MGSRIATIIMLLSFGWTASLEAHATEYHVDAARGSDDAPGTEAQPFRTVLRASESLQPGDRAIIHEGVYHEQIVGGKSGHRDAPIVYEGVDRDKVVLKGSVLVRDWVRRGHVWIKRGLHPITPQNAFVMVDERRLLERVEDSTMVSTGTFFLSKDGTYIIRLWDDANPNTEHSVEVYEYDFAFNSGDRWNGTAKQWIVLRTMTLEKYGAYALSTDADDPQSNSHWELDRLRVRYNNAEGVFYCLDDWLVHDCELIRNRGHGCQINGARVRFVRNICSENEWFGPYEDGGCGLLVGPDATAHSCEITHNVFESNGDPDGYGCGVYFEGRARDNRMENNLVIGGTSAGICFYGSARNRVASNVLISIAPRSDWEMAAAFVLHHSFEGAPTRPEANVIERNTVWGCPRAIVAESSAGKNSPKLYNCFVNNLFARCRFGSSFPAAAGIAMESNLWHECSPDLDRGAFGLASKLKRSLKRLIEGAASEVCNGSADPERSHAPGVSSSTVGTESHSSPVSFYRTSGDRHPAVSRDRSYQGSGNKTSVPAGHRPEMDRLLSR